MFRLLASGLWLDFPVLFKWKAITHQGCQVCLGTQAPLWMDCQGTQGTPKWIAWNMYWDAMGPVRQFSSECMWIIKSQEITKFKCNKELTTFECLYGSVSLFQILDCDSSQLESWMYCNCEFVFISTFISLEWWIATGKCHYFNQILYVWFIKSHQERALSDISGDSGYAPSAIYQEELQTPVFRQMTVVSISQPVLSWRELCKPTVYRLCCY